MPIDFRPKKWRETKNKIKYKSQKIEEKVSKQLDMQLTKGSGSQVLDKGDLKSEKFLVEEKHSSKLSLSIKKHWLKKIREEAGDRNKFWALCIDFIDKDTLEIEESGVMISKDLFILLRKHLEDVP